MKNLKNLGETLNKEEQQAISGGHNRIGICGRDYSCPQGYCCGLDPYRCVLSSANGRNCR